MMRMLVSPQPRIINYALKCSPFRYDGLWPKHEDGDGCHYIEALCPKTREPREKYISCGRSPLGEVGDKLLVKEPWGVDRSKHDNQPEIVYYVDRHDPFLQFPTLDGAWKCPHKLPAVWVRKTIKITQINIERIRRISLNYSDICREGFSTENAFETYWGDKHSQLGPEARWRNNPFVWVYSFITEDNETAREGKQ